MSLRIAIGPSSFAAENAAPLKTLEAAGYEVIPNPFGRRLTEAEIIAHLDGVAGLIAGLEPLTASVFESAPDLKAIARVGIGMDNVDLEAAKTRGIKVSNTPDAPTAAVAELTLTAMLALCRRIVPANAALHEGAWKKIMGQGLSGANVLIIGYGRIGRKVAEFVQAFGGNVTVYDPYLNDANLPSGIESVAFLDQGLMAADIVALHASGDLQIFGPKEFDAMQEGAFLLNAARGELVDEDALIAALDSGKLAGAWFDAFWEEPYTGPLTEYEQVLLTPHVGTYTRQCRLAMESAAVANLLRDLDEA